MLSNISKGIMEILPLNAWFNQQFVFKPIIKDFSTKTKSMKTLLILISSFDYGIWDKWNQFLQNCEIITRKTLLSLIVLKVFNTLIKSFILYFTDSTH